MKNKRAFSKKTNLLKIRQQRYFSESFKKQKVKELVNKTISIRDVCELYDVSRSAVYKWIYKYSVHHTKGTNQIVEMESEAAKTRVLRQRVAELERVIGRKQLTIDYLEKLIEIASEELGYDLKKNSVPPPSNGSDATGKTTPTS